MWGALAVLTVVTLAIFPTAFVSETLPLIGGQLAAPIDSATDPYSARDRSFESDDNTRQFESDDNTRNFESDDNTRANTGGLTNPLKSKTIEAFFLAILDILLVFALPIIVLFIMYAGFLYVTAQGDPTKIKTAHAALTWSVIGGVIVLGAKLIIDVIQNTVNAL